MRSRVLSQSAFVLFAAWAAGLAAGTDLQLRHHFIDRTLPVSNTSVGDYGLTALVDLDRDGNLSRDLPRACLSAPMRHLLRAPSRR